MNVRGAASTALISCEHFRAIRTSPSSTPPIPHFGLIKHAPLYTLSSGYHERIIW